MTQYVGVLTAGGDTPGLNAALRGLGKSAYSGMDMKLIGFYDGFRGLMQNRAINLDESALSGILTVGGTILGTSRDKPNRMPVGGQTLDMTEAMVDTYKLHHLNALVCIGGGGTQKNSYLLAQKGLNIITIPKSIDNDVACTDVSIGFDTALGIATDAIDRLHSTAHSHHRIILVELMGHNTGWLALGAGVSGGADVILIPEIPYNTKEVAEAILQRSRGGKQFSIVAVSEGAMSQEEAERFKELNEEKEAAENKEKKDKTKNKLLEFQASRTGSTLRLAQQLEQLTRLESRVTILGYVQRGGTPSAMDRLLATELGTTAAAMAKKGAAGIMVAVKNGGTEPVALETVVNQRRTVPLDHKWLKTARRVGTCLGD
jgi:ATP-dependent phosphofructokinase / diphosphate-dependent phosphofructokinase